MHCRSWRLYTSVNYWVTQLRAVQPRAIEANKSKRSLELLSGYSYLKTVVTSHHSAQMHCVKVTTFPLLTKSLFAHSVPNGSYINTEGQIKDCIVLFFAIAWRALFSKLIRSGRKNKAQWTFTLTTKHSPYLIECPGLCSTTLGHKAYAI